MEAFDVLAEDQERVHELSELDRHAGAVKRRVTFGVSHFAGSQEPYADEEPSHDG